MNISRSLRKWIALPQLGILIVMVVVLSACANRSEITMTTSSDEQQLRQWFADWEESTESGDQERTRKLLADDVVLLVPGFGAMDPEMYIEGASGSPEKLALYDFSGGSEIEEIRVSGDMAYMRTKSDFSILEKASGKTTRYIGHSLSIFRKNDEGEWVMSRDANTIMPVEEK